MTPCNKAAAHRQNFAEMPKSRSEHFDSNEKRAGALPAL
jgi:hypothetical protein